MAFRWIFSPAGKDSERFGRGKDKDTKSRVKVERGANELAWFALPGRILFSPTVKDNEM